MPQLITLFAIIPSFLLSLPALADTSLFSSLSIRGLKPSLAQHYPNSPSANFTCLDGSSSIPFSAINDDYCDCPDGSDEPGTSACATATFYCANEGHISGSVLSSRVNDGLCECCDGSDEWATGACPNRCTQIGREYRETIDAELKTRKTGAKIRSTYVKWALGEKKRLEEELEQKKRQVRGKETEVEQARLSLERTEARSKEDLERRRLSPVYTSLLTHRLALTRLRSKTAKLQTEFDNLHGILEELAKGYNPNYQDMAVKAAVVGYEELNKAAEVGEEVEEDIGDEELDELEKKDLEGLLLMDAGDVVEVDEEGGVYEYIPDVFYDSWENLRDFAIDWMVRVGILGKGSKGASKPTGADGPQVAAAREKHNTASNDLNRLNTEITSTADTLERMNTGFGPGAEWKKLDGTCVDKVSGDYTYELCFFGRATQKSNKDSSSNFLGSFVDWNGSAAPGTFEHYTRQNYRNGRGEMLERTDAVDIICGTTNALLSISEPEKCEYHFRVTSPALCWPIDQTGINPSVREEL
ncbi:MAG: hypothetical protein TREMPRED_002209 [Tremellales sp. Tagirdzhanova-0007]|nr:MAG: hypothetical protein TREMPRED_002209 [Tremellales sp. Tagirdzhanova-0007]